MAQDETKPTGPDLSQLIPSISFPMAKYLSVMLAEKTSYWCGGDPVAHCTQYRGPLAEGLVVGDTVRVSVTSRLLRSAHWRGSRSASVEPDCVLAGRGARRKDLGKREAFPETECGGVPCGGMVSPRLCRGRNK